MEVAHMLYQIFDYGSFPFILFFLIIPALLMIPLVDYNRGGSALGVVLITAALVTLFSDFNVLTWIIHNGYTLIGYLLIYLAIGVLYGFVRWYFFLLNKRDEYGKLRESELVRWLGSQNRYTDLTQPGASAEFKTYIFGRNSGLQDFPPHPRNHKARITTWMAYWPFSALWTLTHEPLYRLYNFIRERTMTIYTRMSRKVFGGFSEFND
jgi:hypothetical protein